MSNTNVGSRIRQYRKLAGLTQEDLAERTGLSVISVSNIERGVNKPSFDNFVAIANAMGGLGDYRVPDASETENEVMGKLSKQRFYKCLSEMKPKYRDILLMRYYFEKDDKVIAVSLGLTDSAVRKRLERARKDLILRYRGDNGEE